MGGAIALRFAKEGYAVALLSRSLDNLKPIAEHITAGGGTADCFACDVSDETAVEDAFAAVKSSLGMRMK